MQTVDAKVRNNQQSISKKWWQRGWQKCYGGRWQTTVTSGDTDGDTATTTVKALAVAVAAAVATKATAEGDG
jgi:hypothetical protein